MEVDEFVDRRNGNSGYRVSEVATNRMIYVGNCREVLKSLEGNLNGSLIQLSFYKPIYFFPRGIPHSR